MKKIFVIDDDKSIRDSFNIHLKDKGYDVKIASSAIAALEILNSYNPDLIISDIRMEGMTGLELLEKLKERNENYCVILISAYEDMESTISAMQAGAFDYIKKPIDIHELDLTIQKAFKHIKLNQKLNHLSHEVSEPFKLNRIIGKDKKIIDNFKTIGMLSNNNATVLITGESGTGKELIAKAIHYNSKSKDNPFIAINCTSFSESILESELFGHVKGAFTGAISDKKGKFELAQNGTIFLDEIGDTTLNFQSKLLRVLQEKEYYKVGGDYPLKLNARVIAATNRSLTDFVKDEKFREDLYYRLKVMEIHVPSLRERKDDIPIIAEYILNKIKHELHKELTFSGSNVTDYLMQQQWKGNIRELENMLMRAAILSKSNFITVENLKSCIEENSHQPSQPVDLSLDNIEKLHIIKILESTNWNKTKTCEILKISKPRLDRKIKDYQINK
ncbi:MAG: sigma-54-dependent Fis family transcriptional regulator [Bacteroidetes bacterium]|nr:sigma-54-dependent Fis family transcriptional regulator [Bacteroidota bacterium]